MERVAEIPKQHEQSSPVPSRAPGVPTAAAPLSPLQELQQQAGNQAIQQLLRSRFLRPKLAISNPDDPDEREADQVAQTVMRSPTGFPISEVEADRVASQVMLISEPQSGSAGSGGAAPAVQAGKRPVHPKKAELSGVAMRTAPPQVEQVLSRAGKTLDDRTRQFMELRFGWDFSGVRVHTDEAAANSAQSIGARAYAVGENIVFDRGQYQPETHSGRLLLAHELTHTLQSSGALRRQGHANVTDPPATLEVLVIDAKNEVTATWRAAGMHGVQVYLDSQILKRLEDLEKKQHADSWKEFFIKLAEFAVAFIPGGEEAEGAIEGVKRVAEITAKFADFLGHMPEHLEQHPDLDALRNGFDHSISEGADAILADINSSAAAILRSHPGITHNRALALLLQHYFTDKTIEVIGGQEGMIEDNPPRLNYEVIAHRMEKSIRWAVLVAEKKLSKRLEEVEPGSSLAGNIRSEIAFVQAPDGNLRVALLRTDYSLYRALPHDPNALGQPQFVEWVPIGQVSDALVLQSSMGPLRNYSWDEVKLFMAPSRPPALVEWLKQHGAAL